MSNPSAIEKEFADVIMQRPHEFRIGRRSLYLYPLTLGKTFVLRGYLEALGVDVRMMSLDPFVECLRLAESKQEICSEILAIHTAPNTRRDLFDSRGIASRKKLMMRLKPEHLAGLLMIVLTGNHSDEIMRHFGMEEERRRLSEVLRLKRSGEKSTLTFGGKTLIGTFICQLKEMGYSDDEILFVYGYDYLRMVLADKLTTLYLSVEELESLPSSSGGTLLDGEDPLAMEKLEAMIKGN